MSALVHHLMQSNVLRTQLHQFAKGCINPITGHPYHLRHYRALNEYVIAYTGADAPTMTDQESQFSTTSQVKRKGWSNVTATRLSSLCHERHTIERTSTVGVKKVDAVERKVFMEPDEWEDNPAAVRQRMHKLKSHCDQRSIASLEQRRACNQVRLREDRKRQKLHGQYQKEEKSIDSNAHDQAKLPQVLYAHLDAKKPRCRKKRKLPPEMQEEQEEAMRATERVAGSSGGLGDSDADDSSSNSNSNSNSNSGSNSSSDDNSETHGSNTGGDAWDDDAFEDALMQDGELHGSITRCITITNCTRSCITTTNRIRSCITNCATCRTTCHAIVGQV